MKCLRCFLFGHRWFTVTHDESAIPGYRKVTKNYDVKFCLRCGELNPSYEEEPEQWPGEQP